MSGVAAVVVLAAGGGTRMKSQRSKLLHEVAGRSMLSWALQAARGLQPEHIVVVVGHLREQVLAHLAEHDAGVETAVQEEQKGTGHAVQCGLADLGQLEGEVVVTYGDVPMLTGETLRELVAAHRERQAQVTVLTARVANPFGYGRIVRDAGGDVERIVEQKDADERVAALDEINSGIYVFDAAVLRDGLGQLRADNAQGEYYLTDMVQIARAAGHKVAAHVIGDVWQTEGVNDRVQLAAMNAEVNRRVVERWMRAGVTVLDPATTWIHDTVDLGTDVTLRPNVALEGATSVADGATLGPDVTLRSTEVGARASIVRADVELAVIGADAVVGPYAHLRPGTEVGEGAHVGSFVELRNTTVAPGATVTQPGPTVEATTPAATATDTDAKDAQ